MCIFDAKVEGIPPTVLRSKKVTKLLLANSGRVLALIKSGRSLNSLDVTPDWSRKENVRALVLKQIKKNFLKKYKIYNFCKNVFIKVFSCRIKMFFLIKKFREIKFTRTKSSINFFTQKVFVKSSISKMFSLWKMKNYVKVFIKFYKVFFILRAQINKARAKFVSASIVSIKKIINNEFKRKVKVPRFSRCFKKYAIQ